MASSEISEQTSAQDTSPVGGFVRLAGVGVLIAGIAIGYQVVVAAWQLFENQDRVAKMAETFETHAGLNAALQAFAKMKAAAPIQAPAAPPQQGLESATAGTPGAGTSSVLPDGEAKPPPPAEAPTKSTEMWQALGRINLTYILAWYLVFLLLGLIARIASWAIVEGGRLAIARPSGSNDIRQFARDLVTELRRVDVRKEPVPKTARPAES